MEQVKKCPTCGTVNAASEAFCSKCGGMMASVPLSSEETQAASPEQKPDQKTEGIVCPDPTCKYLNPPGQELCIMCNRSLVPAAAAEKAKEDKLEKKVSEPPPQPSSVQPPKSTTCIPYKTGGKEFLSLHDIALYFSGDWNAGMEQIDDNYILKWAESNFPQTVDVDSIEFLKKLFTKRNRDHDIRLLQFIVRFAPELPPIWKGIPLSPDNLITILEQAVNGDGGMQANMFEIFSRDVLKAAIDINDASDLKWCMTAIADASDSYNRSWQSIADAGGTIGAMPTPSQAATTIMLAALSEKFRESLRGTVKSEFRNATKYCSWFASLGNPGSADAGKLVVMKCVGPDALALANKSSAACRAKILKFSLAPIAIAVLAAGYYNMPKNAVTVLKEKAANARILPVSANVMLKKATVTAASANLRTEPSPKAHIMARLSKGYTVYVVSSDGDWLKCRLSNKSADKEGWIRKNLLQMN